MGRLGGAIGVSMLVGLAVLHLELANQSLFPQDTSGIAFLGVIFVAVGAIGAMLLLIPPVRRLLSSFDQPQLLLLVNRI